MSSQPHHARRVRAVAAPILAFFVLVPAACTSSGSGSSSSASATASSSSGGGAATVGVTTVSLGKILVDGQGRSLYLFEADTSTKSTCSGQCAAAWPPLLTKGTPSVSGDAQASKVGTTTRDDGTTQVTYNGHPLYLYAGDSKAGDTNGEGSKAFGAGWYVLSPAGDKIDKD
jgi:predicted lipoprotein with Yx(FWY)xxD motif